MPNSHKLTGLSDSLLISSYRKLGVRAIKIFSKRFSVHESAIYYKLNRLGIRRKKSSGHVSEGYFVVPVFKDGKTKFVREHRIVAEKKLGRPLTRKEHVHHKNGNGLDNRPENLEVLSNSEHIKKHATSDRMRWTQSFLPRLEQKKIKCGGRTLTCGEWSKITGVPVKTIGSRINRGWSPKRAIFEKWETRLYYFVYVNGKKMKLQEACSLLGKSYGTVKWRISVRGMTPQEALNWVKQK